MKRSSHLGDTGLVKRIVKDLPGETPVPSKPAAAQPALGRPHITRVLTSKPLKEAWPETRARIEDVIRALRLRADHWAEHQAEEKPQYRHIVTPQSKRNRAALLERVIVLMDDHLARHPEAADDCIEVHSCDPDAGDFLAERLAAVPEPHSLQGCSRGGYLVYAGNDRNPLDGPQAGDCVVIAGAPEGGGGALKLISPCWGQEEQAFMQMGMLFIAIHGEGFTTRHQHTATGNLMEITPVLVKNVVPLAMLGSGAGTTRKPVETKDRNGNVKPPYHGTSVFHASPEQFDPQAALPAREGPHINALFYSFADMRERSRSGQLDYGIEDLFDMATSVGKAVRLWADGTPPKQQLHAIGVGTGIYGHAECVSTAMTMLMLALQGRTARLYGGEKSYQAARDMVTGVLEAMTQKIPPAEGFTVGDFVRELHARIGGIESEEDKAHWRIGGQKQAREQRVSPAAVPGGPSSAADREGAAPSTEIRV